MPLQLRNLIYQISNFRSAMDSRRFSFVHMNDFGFGHYFTLAHTAFFIQNHIPFDCDSFHLKPNIKGKETLALAKS